MVLSVLHVIPYIPNEDEQRHWKTMVLQFHIFTYFRVSKNVKIGTRCSTVIPDSPPRNSLRN
ncbi:hypothetical protein BC749_106321 [Flavobacterium araucananum]|nr:hypothetical protein BC749_106321 [Flavobacterium araucananum]